MHRTLLLYLHQDELPEEYDVILHKLLPGYTFLVTKDTNQILPLADEIVIAAGWLTVNLLHQLPNVKWLHHWAAGVESFISDTDIMARDFILTNGSGVHGIPVSEQVFAYILAFARELPRAIRAQLQHQWSTTAHPRGNAIFECSGKKILIFGFGAIGQQTAKLAKGFNMQVIGVKRDHHQKADYADVLINPTMLHAFLPEADFVVLTAPLTTQTKGLFGRKELKLMKSTSYLINVGRGQIVREDALIHALQVGWIAGAGLDVFEREPLPEDSPLWGMENVIITAHYAGNTPRYNQRALDIFIENVKRYLSSEAMINLVDSTLEY